MAKSYSEKLKDPRWQRKRLEIMQRDDFKCTICGNKKLTLHVHHKQYTGKNPWDYDNSDLTTICENCHLNEHKNDKIKVEVFGCIEGGIYKVADFLDRYPEVRKLFTAIENYKGDWDLHLRNETEWPTENDSCRSYYQTEVYKAIDNLVKFTDGSDVNYFININGERLYQEEIINGEIRREPINFYDYVRFYLYD